MSNCPCSRRICANPNARLTSHPLFRRSVWQTAWNIIRGSFRAGRSSASPSRLPLSPTRRFWWRMNRPATWTPNLRKKSCSSLHSSIASFTRRASWSRTTPARSDSSTPFIVSTRAYLSARRRVGCPPHPGSRCNQPSRRGEHMTKFTRLLFKNLLRRKRRTVLTILSIAVSLFIFAVLVSLPTFANQMLADTASSVRIVSRTKMGFAYPLPEAYKVKIATIPHVVAVAGLVIYGGIYHEPSDQFPSVATDAEEIDMWADWGLTGVDHFKQIKTACLVAEGTMRRFNLHVGQHIQLRGTVYPFNVTLTIVGTIAKGPVPSFLIFRLDYFEEAAGNPGIAHDFWVRVDDSRVVPEVAAAIDHQFANSPADTRSGSEAAAVGSILGRYRIFMILAECLGLVAVVAIGLVAANTAAMSIRERRGEIAVMRSLGFSSGVILSLLVGESLIIALWGGAIGYGVAFGLFKVFALNADALGPFVSLHVPPFVLAETLGLAALIGLVSAYVPARSAARRSIVDTLRLVD